MLPGPLHTVLDALAAPVLDPASRTFWGGLVAAAILALVLRWLWRGEGLFGALRGGLRSTGRALWHRSSRLDLQLVAGRQLLRALGVLPVLGASLWVATWMVRGLDATLGRPTLDAPAWVATLVYTAALFVAWDLSRYVLHRLMHRVPVLWAFHQVHHSAEVLTPLTLHRVHPVESALYQLRGMLVSTAVVVPFFWLFREGVTELTFLGVHAVGFAFNAVTGNLRHSHVWLRFGPRIERWLISPAQHQIHHSADPDHHDTNFGTWLAVWDRIGRSLVVAGRTAPRDFGLPESSRNHGHDLLSAWFGPFRELPTTRGALVATTALAVLLVPGPGAAQDGESAPADDDAEDTPPDDDDADLDVIVESDNGVPTVAGSAHLIDEAQLERFEHDDIHRVLAEVPGVYVRGEDGFGLRPNIGIRGAASERSAKLTLLEDGIPFAPAPYAAPAAYYFPQTTRLVGIEVFKGPAATQHGPHTIGGAINLRTRAVPRDGPAAAIDLAGGQYGSLKGHGWVGVGSDRGGVLVELVQLTSQGFKTLDDGGPTGFDRTEGMVKGRLVVHESDRATDTLELKLGVSRERSNETYLGLHRDDWEATPYRRYASSALGLMAWERTQAELSWSHRVGRSLSVRTTAYHHALQRSWAKLNRFADGPDLHDLLAGPDSGLGAVYLAILRGEADSSSDDERLLIGTNDRRFYSGGLQSVARWQLGADEPVGARAEFGVRVHHDAVARLHTEDAYDMRDGVLVSSGLDTVTNVDLDTTATALAAHTHWDIRMRRLHVEPGLRVEHVRTTYDNPPKDEAQSQARTYVMPGLGVLGNIGEHLDVFAGVHRGFSPVAPGQPADTRAEVAVNAEAGARVHRYDLRIDGSLFVSDYGNLTGQCSIAGGCDDEDLDRQYNAGSVLIGGAELAVSDVIPLAPGWTLPLGGSYTWTESAFKSSFDSNFPQFGAVAAGDVLPYVPRHQGSARVGVAHERGTVDLSTELRGGMHDAAADPTDEPEVPALFLLHAAASTRITGRLWVYGTVRNVTDQQTIVSWRPVGIRAAAPRQVMIGVKVR